MKKKIMVAVLAATLACSVVAGCGSDNSSSNSKTETTSTVAESESSNESSQAEATNAEATNTVLELEDQSTVGNFEITVTKISYRDEMSDNSYLGYKADDGSTYLVVSMDIKNVGTSSDTFLPSIVYGDKTSAKVIYDGTYTYSGTYMLTMYDDLHTENLNPLETASGFIAFSVPEEVRDSGNSLILEISAGSNDVVQYNLR